MAESEKSVELFALSTCVWCKRTRAWLDEHGVNYTLNHVDLLTGEEKEEVVARAKTFVERVAYPIVVIDGGDTVIQGFHPEQMEEVLG